MATTNMFNHLDGHGFEERVSDILEAAGKGSASLQPLSNDQGFDIILITPNDRKIGIQCKHTAHRVGRPVLHNLLGASANKGFDEIWVITSNDFSHYAEEYANEMNQVGKYPIIKLIDGYMIGKLYRDNRLKEQKINYKLNTIKNDMDIINEMDNIYCKTLETTQQRPLDIFEKFAFVAAGLFIIILIYSV